MTESTCKIPTVADALCKTHVISMPATIPTKGFENVGASFANSSETPVPSFITSLIIDIPVIRTANPRRISPIWFCVGLLQNIRRIIPITATTHVKVEVESSLTHTEPPSPSIPERQTTQPVTLVPSIAPRMMPIA